MIAYLHGTLAYKSPTDIVVDVNGIGYHLQIPLSTFEQLGDLRSTIKVFTYLHVREDALQLFGFSTEQERILFLLLISVSGVGPKIAQGILSGVQAEELRQHLASGNVAALTSIHGVGKKTAERLILELKDKIGKPQEIKGQGLPAGMSADVRGEALLALISLGYQRSVAESAIRKALREATENKYSVQDLIKRALHHSSQS
jgi:Holliday junction DNA helicase RuvA